MTASVLPSVGNLAPSPSVGHSEIVAPRGQFLHGHGTPGTPHTTGRERPAGDLLRRQRDLPLPRPGVRRAALRARPASRRRLAADRKRGPDLRALAEAVACPPRARPLRPAAG